MRALEAVLSLTNLVALFVIALPLPSVVRWMRYSVPVALLLAVAQSLVEGLRWQMAPAYALAGLLFLAWLLWRVAPADRQRQPGPRAGPGPRGAWQAPQPEP